MNSGTAAPDRLFGAEVADSQGNKLGTVDGVWIDDATNALEFVSVKTGWLMGKSHMIPTANAQVSEGSITVPYPQDQIKDAPSFRADDELSPQDEDSIYSYYGLNRSTAPSPSGLPTGGDAGYQSGTSDRDQSVTLHEEELQVGKRAVEAGRVRLRKVVHTEHQEVPVDLRREEVQIERVPASSTVSDDNAFQEQEIGMPVMREEAVVGREARATEQVRLNKTVQTETQTVGDDVRREDVDADTDVTDDTNRRRR